MVNSKSSAPVNLKRDYPAPSLRCVTQQKSLALNNARLHSFLKFVDRRFALPVLFSRLFYVAASRLNSPRFVRESLKHRDLLLSSTTADRGVTKHKVRTGSGSDRVTFGRPSSLSEAELITLTVEFGQRHPVATAPGSELLDPRVYSSATKHKVRTGSGSDRVTLVGPRVATG